ncbi:MAG: aminotransferase class V-fold PLP-dependent enzyme [Verrucomicrobia bacterium]|nr:aminotransferase class V-fold PLP-dependent enzyme [Verrucomicrobiota bacterium]
MKTLPPELQLKIATEPWEIEQIHRLNYRTFVEEIPQHAPNPEGRLVDRFHAENTYVIALQDRTLAGMMALRPQRPFSLDAKLPNLDTYLPAGRRPIEVRLLAVAKEFRKTSLFLGLFEFAVRRCLEQGFDIALISGTTRQLKLYRHLGFIPFGPLVGTAEAPYQPMYLTLEAFGQTLEKSVALREKFTAEPPPVRPLNLLPGPVRTAPEVDAALASPAISHRGPAFLKQLAALRSDLCAATGARDVQIVPGSGSLGTAMVAAQLSLHATTGLVLSNGEFGERLAAEARRAGLRFDWLRLRWGDVFDLEQVAAFVARVPRGGWVWCVHHETSTGVLNPLDALKALAVDHGLHFCADCISSLGAVPVDLRGVHLATATSGKGLGAFPGLALVFHDYVTRPEPDRLPGYLDLGHWAAGDSAAHTHPSNLVAALAAAVRLATPERRRRIAENGAWLRHALRQRGYTVVAPESAACPALVTLAVEPPGQAALLGEELERRGFWLNFRSAHLLSRGWVQASLLGDPPRADLERFLHTLHVIDNRPQTASSAPLRERQAGG